MIARQALACFIGLAISVIAHADGPGGYRPRPDSPAAISGQDAITAYDAGYASILRAEHQDALAAASTTASERTAATRAARSSYEEALRHFESAVRFDVSMHEAYTYMGYANRKLGRHEKALAAYDKALSINPDYPHAIEYQGVAFLGLNRIDEARFNYLRLYALDQAQAHELFVAMQGWLAANQAKPPAGVDVAGFAQWLTERAATTEREGASPSSGW
jgi:tetratricopeptide (TPR) repeat protein